MRTKVYLTTLSLALTLISLRGYSQSYTISSGGTVNTCSGTFYDSGGPGGAYSNGENVTMTFCSDQPGDQIVFDFTTFAVENGFDNLIIYDGPNNTFPQFPGSPFSGGNAPGIITSSSGCITFTFTSDGSVTPAGWVASISCITLAPPTCTDGIQNGSETGIDCGGPCPACTDILISQGGTINGCGGTFYDSGGIGGNYGNGENFTITFCSDQPGDEIMFDFTSFAVENGFDNLTVYDGPNTGSPQIPGSPFSGGNAPGIISSTSGCLTFVFTSDGSVTPAGWVATISCFTPGPPDLYGWDYEWHRNRHRLWWPLRALSASSCCWRCRLFEFGSNLYCDRSGFYGKYRWSKRQCC